MTVTAYRRPRRSPSPVGRATARTTLWRIATVTRQRGHQLRAGQHVVLSERGVTEHAPAFGVVASTPAGALTRATVPATSLRLLPDTYRARPCLAPCGAEDDCWTLDRLGEPRTHHATLDAALSAAVTHYARKATAA